MVADTDPGVLVGSRSVFRRKVGSRSVFRKKVGSRSCLNIQNQNSFKIELLLPYLWSKIKILKYMKELISDLVWLFEILLLGKSLRLILSGRIRIFDGRTQIRVNSTRIRNPDVQEGYSAWRTGSGLSSLATNHPPQQIKWVYMWVSEWGW